MTLNITDLRAFLPSCCDARAAAVSGFPAGEAEKILELFPKARTVIVIGHHVRESLEWVWFPFASSRRGVTCAADLHAGFVAEQISCYLASRGWPSCIVPYPGASGLLFKDIATRAGLGSRGDHFLLLHHEWGPWIHLRVVLTSAEIAGEQPAPAGTEAGACTHCHRCRDACPGKAIGDGVFDAGQCNRTQGELERTLGTPGYAFKCEICLRACPLGTRPAPVRIGK